jgi:hypothetical protein
MLNKFLIFHLCVVLFTLSVHAAPFIDNNNGTIKDEATGLIWEKCSMGQKDDANCTGEATKTNWYGALKYCDYLNKAKRRNWRLPTKEELETIVNKQFMNQKERIPTIDPKFFPNTFPVVYWSSTTYAPNTTGAWLVHFLGGFVRTANKSNSYYVRCVSGP